MKKFTTPPLPLAIAMAALLGATSILWGSLFTQGAQARQVNQGITLLAQQQVWVQWFSRIIERQPLYVCTADAGGSLNLRNGPNGTVITAIPNNTLLIATGEVLSPINANNPFEWVEVFYDETPNTGHFGWVSVRFLCY